MHAGIALTGSLPPGLPNRRDGSKRATGAAIDHTTGAFGHRCNTSATIPAARFSRTG